MGIPISFDINDDELYVDILQEVAVQSNKILIAMSRDDSTLNHITLAIDNAIRSSPEYTSLISGVLKDMFGLTDSQAAVENIIAGIKNNIEIDVKPAVVIGKTLSGGIIVKVLRSDLSDVLNVSGAKYESPGGEVAWLSWLLKGGDAVVVGGYEFSSFATGDSRTGGGLMIRSPEGFRVPPEYSGTASSNWLTRSLEDLDEQICNILYGEFIRRLNA